MASPGTAPVKSYGTPQVAVSGEWFRTKVRLALRHFTTNYPRLARKYVEECKRLKSDLRSGKGFDTEGANALTFMYPPLVDDWLRMSEWASKFYHGVPFGTGLHDWDRQPNLNDIFKQECIRGTIGSLQGGTVSRGRRS